MHCVELFPSLHGAVPANNCAVRINAHIREPFEGSSVAV